MIRLQCTPFTMKGHQILLLLLIPLVVIILYVYFFNVPEVEQHQSKKKSISSTTSTNLVFKPIEKPKEVQEQKSVFKVDPKFRSYIESRKDNDNNIFVALVDMAHIDMALNFYLTSLKKLNIENYAFVGGDDQVCDKLGKAGISCFTKFSHGKGSDSAIYGSMDFNQKTHYKAETMLEILHMGINVIISDNDVVYWKNPIPYFTCSDCDIQFQNDQSGANSGFYYARSTPASIDFFTRTSEAGKVLKDIKNDQDIFQYIIVNMVSLGQIEIEILDKEVFVNGQHYFEEYRIMFNDDPQDLAKQAVMMHNNWIVGREAKAYRFKELLMWHLDNDGYYSSTANKYLMYDNPYDFESSNLTEEMSSLKAAFAIGHILNRKVILPVFACRKCGSLRSGEKRNSKCPLICLYRVKSMDMHLGDMYREHSFLGHPLVPHAIKSGVSEMYVIMSDTVQKQYKVVAENKELKPLNSTLGPSADEISKWFDNVKDPVLKLHSLYGVFESVIADPKLKDISEKIEKGVDNNNDYMQW